MYVPFFGHCAAVYLRRPVIINPELQDDFFDETTPNYFMYITRVSRYDRTIQYLENNYEPIFQIRRQKATLVKVFKNTERKRKSP